MQELGLMIAQLKLNDTVFRSDKASNYLVLKARLGVIKKLFCNKFTLPSRSLSTRICAQNG